MIATAPRHSLSDTHSPIQTEAKDFAPHSAGTNDISSRKLSLLKRSGLFGADTRGATIERACSLADLRAAYRLVHDVYLGTGFVMPEPSGLRLRLFETTSETATFIAKDNGKVVGVLSVVGDSVDLGLPSDLAFKSELDVLRAAGQRVCEVTNQAVAVEYRRSAIPTELMRCAIAHQIKAGYQAAVVSISPSHLGFYDLLGFKPFGALRSYSQKLYDPVIALVLDVNRYRDSAADLPTPEKFIHALATVSNPYLQKVSGWAIEARSHFLNPTLLKELFVTERNFLGECSRRELKILQRRWGLELFRAVKSPTAFAEDCATSFESVVSVPPLGNTRSTTPRQNTRTVPASGFTRVLRELSPARPRRTFRTSRRLDSAS